MLKAGDLARREDRRVNGVKIGKTRRDRGISYVCLQHWGRAEDNHGIVSAVWEKCHGFVLGKNGSAILVVNSHGLTKWLSQQCGAFSRDLLDKKAKSPLFPRAGGAAWVQLTRAL